MSAYTSGQEGVKARKPHWCTLCGEGIKVGDLYDKRTGVQEGDGFWTMHMHPECHKYEQKPGHPRTVDEDWYEDVSEPAFDREDAIAYVATLTTAKAHGCEVGE